MEREDSIAHSDLEVCRNIVERCRKEVARRIVGQSQIVDGILMALITGGHILLEGVPGLAKTLAVKTFAEISGLSFKRVQFTPDLLPADISGTLIYEQSSGQFTVRKGPVFANIVLADEINRAPAKVQSALLEAMAEEQVTIGENSYQLPKPFFVLATQNPIEQEGTYGLPEAELDRFLLKVQVPYPSPVEEVNIVKAEGRSSLYPVEQILNADMLLKCRAVVDAIVCEEKIIEYIVSIVRVTRPLGDESAKKSDISRYISFGSSPRAGIALVRCAKVQALFAGRSFVLPEDVKAVAHSVLRHRLVLSYEAAADGVDADTLISRILALMPVP